MIVPVIMCGGSGSRLWPLSTPDRPKPFLRVIGGRSLFQETVLRLTGEGFAAPVVIAGEAHADLVKADLAEIAVEADLILEPVARNTALVAAVAVRRVAETHPGALALLSPADHLVHDGAAWREAALAASAGARDRIVTFGIRPTRPETGYGYILPGKPLGGGLHAIARFEEKPTLHRAEVLLQEGQALWNAGVFLFAPETALAEIGRLAPLVGEAAVASLKSARHVGGTTVLDPNALAACPSVSFDHAVMQSTARGAVAPCHIEWSDVGGWEELLVVADRGAESDRVLLSASDGTLVWTEDRPIAVIGAPGLVVVNTPRGILICHRSRLQEVRAAAEAFGQTENAAKLHR
ncbi:sugar phosphate nucleotidyltransferase [Brevundimonas sp. 2R-24]|uniref:Sugar phosphate nucleotidyltransferase n=1 Tax=Peiella sedimenti TaxID=3061083 RepID=A0ABT8SKA9_9CAUL|nr:sugar phosphate nucleotidyltransferase [Caulobacteraceae bacterium XZ-24]